MPATTLGKVHDAAACADHIGRTPWEGCAVYMLWDRVNDEPIYCGTATTPGRLKSHLKNDNPLTPPSSHNLKNGELTRFWQGQKAGWLGVSFRIYSSEAEAKAVERELISAYGIRRAGGKLFNQRFSG
ncbi:MAG: hypothetical protein U1E18_28300 [Brevundimonas sp.]|uniref:hypothetical protein n=1 Tax=Brevundimonas sp. TaxID=1871086 RepID=UPI002ABB03B3|nr:hypothetical protein [Brevundimonas sp.]MDZ4113474.1 hypothetical protein [Brevundimonas sp.]